LSFDVDQQTISKGLELLKDTIPNVRRVAVLSNPANPSHARPIRDLKLAARALGLQLQLLEARGSDEFDSVFAGLIQERARALLVLAEPLFTVHRARLADLAVKNGLPAMYGGREYPEAGGLMSYGPDLRDNTRRAATYVDKILKGAKPADLPIEQPTKFELVINLKTAKALGLTIPRSVLLRADQLIE
jgi:putative ABC transport system substrate-binding protein